MLRREREMRDDRTGWIFPSPHSDSAAGHRAAWAPRSALPSTPPGSTPS